MPFNSLPFAIFFTVFFLLYWLLFNKDQRSQNILILTGSYAFYAWWDWRFIFLLLGSSILNYFLGKQMGKSTNEKYRSLLLSIGLIQCLGCLIFFKYTKNILLPLGISFYTFRIIAWLLDIRSGKIKPTGDWVVFFSYISFFPCIISGPIDRPGTLIPQLEKKRIFDSAQASDGLRQILWGLFKKIVIADNCAVFTSAIFDHYKTLPASSLLLGAFFSAIQIYADFSGYSDMAIGLASLLGLRVTRNFNNPFFARNIADFWRRWHISLTSWLTDYVFSPLAITFRDLGKAGLILAILINFTLIGIWHGPNWTFILFGFLNGCYFIPIILRGTLNKKTTGRNPSPKTVLNIAGTFILVMFTFILFRSASVPQAFDYIRKIFSRTLFSIPVITEKVNTIAALVFIFFMFSAEWLQRDKQHVLQIDFIRKFAVRTLIYYGIVLMILFFSATKSNDFIYLKF